MKTKKLQALSDKKLSRLAKKIEAEIDRRERMWIQQHLQAKTQDGLNAVLERVLGKPLTAVNPKDFMGLPEYMPGSPGIGKTANIDDE